MSVTDIESSALCPRRPLIGLAISAIVGVGLGARFHEFQTVFGVGCAVLIAVALFTFRRTSGGLAMLAASCALFAFRAALVGEVGRKLDLPPETGRGFVSVVGVIVDEPEVARMDPRGRPVWVFPLRVEAVQRAGPWRRTAASLRVVWTQEGARPDLAYGQRWALSGPATRDVNAMGRSLFNLRPLTSSARLLDRHAGFVLRDWCIRGRQYCSAVLGRGVEDFTDSVGLLRALMLGYRQALPDRVYDIFSRTGTLHIVAISGSHIMIFSAIVIALLRAAGVSRPKWLYVLTPLLAVYTMGTGLAPSAVRASVMATAYWAAIPFRRKPDGPTALAMAALVLLMASPMQLFDPGFQLSFIAVAGLMAFYPRLGALLSSPEHSDPLALPHRTWWVRAGLAARRSAVALIAASIAAWLATAPLSAALFNQFTPVALLANLFVIPLASAVLFTACLSLLAAPWSVFLLECFNHANVVFLSLLVWIVDVFDRLPLGHFFVRAPAWSWVALLYLLVAMLFHGARVGRRAAAFALLALAVGGGVFALRDDRVQIEAYGLGKGSAVFVNVPGGKDVLVDPGTSYRSRGLVRWLRGQGVDELRAIVLTRVRADTAGSLPYLLEKIPVRELWIPDFTGKSPTLERVLALAKERRLPVRKLARGDRIPLAGRAEWMALHPPRDGAFGGAAEAGLVSRVARGPSSLLLAGEGSRRMEEDMAKSRVDVSASVVFVGVRPEPEMAPAWGAPGAPLLSCGEGERLTVRFARSRGWRWWMPEVRWDVQSDEG